MSRIGVAFDKARADGRAVLVGCMPAGFPSVEGSIAAMKAMVEAGVDVIEVEIPYSDPVMDGPVIQRASDIALAGGVRTRDTLRIIDAVAATGASVVTMTYWNPIEQYGVDAFAATWPPPGAPAWSPRISFPRRPASGWPPPTRTGWTGRSWSPRRPPTRG